MRSLHFGIAEISLPTGELITIYKAGSAKTPLRIFRHQPNIWQEGFPMSNRLSTVDRVPLIPDIQIASDVADSVRASRARAEEMAEYARQIGDVLHARLVRKALKAVWRGLNWANDRVEEARSINELSKMDDRMLADIGLRRSDIPMLFHPKAVNDMTVRERVAA
jgi:uncharacterized protein YjiS (DUF1127 family)